MKILVISQYYFPEQFRVNDLCEEFVNRGHEVTVLTGLPNYPQGEIYEGYENRQRRTEYINGVKIFRCGLLPRKTGIIRLFLNYCSFAINSTLYTKKLEKDYDLIFVYQLSPVTMAIPALALKRRHNIPIVLYCLDIWPESVIGNFVKKNSIIYKLVKKISQSIYCNCDEIIVSSPSFKDYLCKECKVKMENMQSQNSK